MRIATIAALAGALALAGCGRDGALSGLNPFRSDESVRLDGPAAPPGGAVRPQDDRGIVQAVTFLAVRPIPGGVVIEARGLPPTQGFWDADLVLIDRGADGALTYDLRIAPPAGPRPAGTPASREVVTAVYASDAALRGVSTIRVRGLTGAREVGR